MRARIVVGIAVVLVIGACSDEAGSTAEPPGVTFDRAACHEPIQVSDAAGLLAVIEDLTWDWVGPYSSGSEPDSADVVVTGTITIGGDQIPVPADCLGRADCRDVAVFSADRQGVSIQGSEDWFEGEATLTLSDTTVRLGASLMDTHPGPFNFIPLITVKGPCGEPCGPDQYACQRDLSCYFGYEAYCRFCEERPVEECACQGPEGPLPDGDWCEYFVSGDVIEVGTCRAGVCERSP